MLNPKDVNGILAGALVLHLPQGLASTLERGAGRVLQATQIGFGGAVPVLPSPQIPGMAPGFQL